MQLRLLLRLITRNVEIYFLKIITLAVALAALVFVSVFALNEFGYDRFHQNAEDVFRIIEKKSTETYGRNKYSSKVSTDISSRLLQQQNRSISRTMVLNEINIVAGEKVYYDQKLHTADPAITDIFSFDIADGSLKNFQQNTASILLSDKLAYRYFGSNEVSGKTLELYTFRDTLVYTIAAVYESFPLNAHQKFQGFIHFNSVTIQTLGFNPEVVELYGRMNGMSISKPLLETTDATYIAQPITGIYFGPRMSCEDVAHGDLYSIIILLSITSLTLFLALTSFINLTSLAMPKRAKELAVKKLTGHNRLQLTWSFIGESFIISMISLFIAFVLIWFSQDLSSFMQTLGLEKLIRINIIPLALMIGVFIVLIALSPLLMIKRFINANAIRLLSSEAITFPRFKKVIIILQLGISIFLIVSAIIINRQVTYSLVKEPGRNNYQVVYVNFPEKMTSDELRRLRNGWKKTRPNIVNVMATSQLPNQLSSRDLNTGLYTLSVDSEFNNFFDLEITSGGWFGPNDGDSILLINESAMQQAAINTENLRGVFKGLSNQFNQPEKPAQIVRSSYIKYNYLCIRILEVDILQTIGFLENYFSEGENKATVKFLDSRFESWLNYQIRLNSFTNMLALIAAILSAFAIYGLSISVVRDKLKQIAIRKICGADLRHIVYLLIKEFSYNLFIAIVLFAPITYILLNELLRVFVYSTKLQWLDPVYPLSYCAMVILILCTWQAFNLNKSDLSNALKD